MIQADLWLDRLSVAASIEQAQNRNLWNELLAQLELRLSVDSAVNMLSAGIWFLEMQQEHIANVGTMRYLIPPRLRLRIEDVCPKGIELIELSSLVDALELVTDIRPDKIRTWLRSIDVLLGEQLSLGREVNWSDIGTLQLASNGEYQLHLLDKFVVALNRPLNMFLPVHLVNEACALELPCIDYESFEDIQSHPPVSVIYRNSNHNSISATEELLDGEILKPSSEFTEIKDEESDFAPLDHTERSSATSYRGLKYFAVALIAIIIFGYGGWYWWTRSFVVSNERSSEAADEVAHVVEPKSIEVDSSQTIRPDQLELMIDTVQPIPLSNTESIILKEGDGLMRIAERKYGHKVFWVYIYEENKDILRDPNRIPLGVSLRLPVANKYGIDPNNTKSLERALILQRSLFSK